MESIQPILGDKNFNLVNEWLASKRDSAFLLQKFKSQIYDDNSKTRYRFIPNNQEAAATEAIFELAFKLNPDLVVTEAEASTHTSFYPLWKRALWIYLPEMVGAVANNSLVKLIFLPAAIYLNFSVLWWAYGFTKHFVAAQVVPYVINNIPIEIIRISNLVIQYLTWIDSKFIKILFYTCAVREIILLGPEIPYFTDVVKALSIYTLFLTWLRSFDTIYDFGYHSCLKTIGFMLNGFDNTSQFFLQIARETKSERLAFSKEKARAYWIQKIAVLKPQTSQ